MTSYLAFSERNFVWVPILCTAASFAHSVVYILDFDLFLLHTLDSIFGYLLSVLKISLTLQYVPILDIVYLQCLDSAA